MAHIIGICELGGYLGHIAKVLTLLEECAKQGHSCTLIIPDLNSVSVIEKSGFPLRYICGPKLPMPAFTSSREPVSLSEVLLCAGMGTAEVLEPAAWAWRHLLELLQPDLVFYDYAPTALLGSRGLNFAQVVIGSAFSLPPPLAPLPQFNSRVPIKPQHLLASDQQLLKVWNGFLRLQGLPPLERVCDLFLTTGKHCLIAAPQADGFAHLRNAERYLLLGQTLSKQQEPLWPHNSGLKVFAYLKTEYAHLAAILTMLSKGPYNCCVFISGVGADAFLPLASDHLRIFLQPVNMQVAAEQADWMIYHAGCGTATQAIKEGVASILIPMVYEQLLTANALEKNRLGVIVNPQWSAEQAVATLASALENSQFLQNCRQSVNETTPAQYSLTQFLAECLALVPDRL